VEIARGNSNVHSTTSHAMMIAILVANVTSMSLIRYEKSGMSDVLRGCYEETALVEFRLYPIWNPSAPVDKTLPVIPRGCPATACEIL